LACDGAARRVRGDFAMRPAAMLLLLLLAGCTARSGPPMGAD
jgi:hypothetical protein